MIELLTSSPEVLVALLGVMTSGGLALRALPAVLDRIAKARETEAEAARVEADAAATGAHTTRETVIALMQRAEAAEARAEREAAARQKAEERARVLSIENDRLRHIDSTRR